MTIECYRLVWTSKSLVSSATDDKGQTMLDLAKSRCLELPRLRTDLVKGSKPSEDILNSVGCELIVSDKFLQLLDGLRKPEWLRIGGIAVHVKSEHFSDYSIVDNQGNRFDIADRELSNLTIASGVLIHAEKIVAKISSVPPFDIFPIKPSSWAISGDLYDRLKQNDISGFKVDPIGVVA